MVKQFNLFLLLLLIQNSFIAPRTNPYSHTVVACAIVKNEDPVIEATLDSYRRGGIKAFSILDTGSTDNTIKKIQEFFEKHNITDGYIFQEPFIDFAQSRNRALELAEQAFPHAGFFLMFDAEWYLHGGELLLALCEKEALIDENIAPHSYLINITNPALDFYVQRLFRKSAGIRYVGAVHESPPIGTHLKVPKECFFELSISRYGAEKSQQRWVRDRELLLKEHHQQPDNHRTLFYLAQTYDALGELDKAFEFYKKRFDAGGWEEERWVALFRLANVVKRLSDQENSSYSWNDALQYYLSAYSLRPTRAEPLVRIARHYLEEKNNTLTHLFISKAINIPYPCEDVLFVDKNIYLFDRYDIMAQCAWYCHDFDGGEQAAEKAVEAHPDLAYLRRNLACYLAYKAQKEIPVHH